MSISTLRFRLTSYFFPCISLCFLLVACGDSATSPATDTDKERPDPNPPAEGFNLTDSDARAVSIADSVVWAHGGRRAYDNNRYFSWNFFGARDLLWDKEEGYVRIDFPSREAVYLLDYEDMTGRVQLAGEEVTHPDSLNKYLEQARSIWINDAFWLVHQFKLKDSGVTLKYVGEVAADPEAGRPSLVIDQTFEGVGLTPNNRYRLYVDRENYRINTWAFFRDAADEEAAMSTPWKGYADYNNGLLISTDRGGSRQLTDVATPVDVDETHFLEF